MRPVCAIPGAPPKHRDGVPVLQRDFALPAGPVEHIGRISFEFPVGDGAVFILDVQIEVAMRVGPFHFSDDARQGNRFIAVVFGAERMVRAHGRSRNQEQTNARRPGIQGCSSVHLFTSLTTTHSIVRSAFPCKPLPTPLSYSPRSSAAISWAALRASSTAPISKLMAPTRGCPPPP